MKNLFHFTFIENNDVFTSWQKANPEAIIYQMQPVVNGMNPANLGAFRYDVGLMVIFALPEDKEYP